MLGTQDVKEVLVGTGRLPARQLTAWGGCVIGLVLGVLIACAAGKFLIDAERADANKQIAKTRAEVDSAVAAVKADALKKQQRLSTAPLLYVAGIGDHNSEVLLSMMSKFPAFKTDPYKQLFSELGTMVQKQREQSQSLVAALAEPSIGTINTCSLATGAAPATPLWSSNSASLSADGWRGVTP